MTPPAFDQIAPVSRRVVAYIIDALIAGGLAIVLGGALLVVASVAGGVEGTIGVLLIGGPVVSLLLLGWFVIYTVMQAGAGSIGMRAQGIRLLSGADSSALGFGRALLRNVIFGLTASIVVGYFTPLFDGSGRFQGWHDKVAGSLMVDARVATAHPVAPAASVAPDVPGIPRSPVSAPAAVSPQPVAPTTAPSTIPPRPPAPAAPAAPAAPVEESDSLIAFVPGITQDTPPRPAPAPEPAPEPALDATIQQVPPSPPARDAADDVEDDDVEQTTISVPGHRLVFTWDDGTRVPVSRRTLFGRNPAPEDGATLISVRDETLSLSKTHFEAAAETSGGWVLDRHSTNGMTIVRDGQRIACPAGQRVPVRLGDAIEIGDRIVTIGGYA